MPLSTQLNSATTHPGRSRGGMPAATATSTSQASLHAAHSWQTLVLLAEPQLGPAVRSNTPAYVRFDNPHRAATPTPWAVAQWREDFGWHRSSVPAWLSRRAPASSEPVSSGPVSSGPVSAELPPGAVQLLPALPSALPAPGAEANLRHMLAEVAHDVRSPIAVAQQIIASLVQRADQAAQWTQEHTELLHEAQLRLTQANRWAEGILVHHSLEHGQPVSVRRRFYPQQWLRSVQPLLNSLAKQRRVRLLWIGWDRSLPRLYADANQLSRALLNLVENALQASRPGGEVRVHVAWQTRVTQRMIVTIEDDGRGLSQELLRQINAPLGPTSTTPQGSSNMGLGLTTAKTLVRALGGTLRAHLPSGGGTQFSLMLPVDNYHSLVHSWLQHNPDSLRPASGSSQPRIAIHALRSAPTANCLAMCNEIDWQLQRAASRDDLVYRVARDRWLWLSKQAPASNVGLPSGLSAALRILRARDNAWNLPLDCRQQQVFAWQPSDPRAANYGSSLNDAVGHSCLMRLTSIIAERIAELIGDHVPPIDDLQATESSIVIRPAAGGPERLIRSDIAHWNHPTKSRPAAAASEPTAAATASLAETPSEAFSGTLAELAQQWHARQVRLDQIQTSVWPPRI